MTPEMGPVLISVVAMGLVTLACRATPFVLFGNGRIPPLLDYLQRFMPPMIMTVLVFNSYKLLFPQGAPWLLPTTTGVAISLIVPGIIAAILQTWKRNTLLSIVGATALHMILVRIM